jgi:hypothetical protein
MLCVAVCTASGSPFFFNGNSGDAKGSDLPKVFIFQWVGTLFANNFSIHVKMCSATGQDAGKRKRS